MPYIGRSTDGFGVRNRFLYLASASDTSVSGADANGATLSFSDGAYVDVYLNGVLLKAGTDYNTNTANTIAGLSALAANDEVTVIVYDIFAVADTVSQSSGGTFVGNVNFSGNIDVDGTTNLDAVDIDGALTQDGGAVFNEDSADVDFRVESNGDANALFVEGESDNVGIGNNDPLVKLDVTGSNAVPASSGTSQTGALRLGQGAGNGVMDMGFDTTNSQGWIQATNKANLATNYQLNLNPNGGDVYIGDGNLVVASGHGIDFALTGNGSGSMSSELLDDYEEGTFTPSISVGSGSVTLKSGYDLMSYTKIGNLVNIRGRIETDSVSSPSGTATLTGLPFTSSNSLSERSGRSGGQVLHDTFSGLGGGSVSYQMSENTTTLVLYEQFANGVGSLGDNFQTNSLIVFDFSYPAA